MRVARIALVFLCSSASAAPNVLTVSTSMDSQAAPAVTAAVTATVGGSIVNNPIFIDYDTAIPMLNMASGASTIFSVATGLQVNHSPYVVAAYPVNLSGENDSFYPSVNAANGVVVANGYAAGTAPSSAVQLPASTIVITSTNSADGNRGTGGWGSELQFSASYLGLNTGSDSSDAGNLGGIVAALLYQHSTWNAQDVHAVLRQTSTNWATGYDHTNHGYGTLSYTAANAISGTIYLQAPDLGVQNNGYYLTVTLFPFRQTRRSFEVLYSCTAGYSWPVKNEYTLSDVTAGCGTLLYTSNGTDVTPQFTYAPGAAGTITMVAFTTDGSGGYSRVEQFSPGTFTLSTAGAACQH